LAEIHILQNVINIYFLYWYFQQNQCLNIKNHSVYNIHRLVWGSFARGTTAQLPIVPIHNTALRTVTVILIINFKEDDLDTEYCLNIYKYVVCESRDMSDGSGAYIILLKLKTILFDLFSSLLIFIIIKTILSTFFYCL
jgi:hypothetical protein